MLRSLPLSILVLATGCWIDKYRPQDGDAATDIGGAICDAGTSAPVLHCMPYVQLLTPAGAGTFGASLAMASNTLLVGSPKDKVNNFGLAYVFDLTASPESMGNPVMLPNDTQAGGQFGGAVALAPGTAYISNLIPVADVYPYSTQASPWMPGTPIQSGLGSGSFFGQYLAFDGATLLAVAPVPSKVLFSTTPGMTPSPCPGTGTACGPAALSGSWAVVAGSSATGLFHKDGSGTWTMSPLAFPTGSGYAAPATGGNGVAMDNGDLLVSAPKNSSTYGVISYSLSASNWGTGSPVLEGLGAVTAMALSGDLAVAGASGTAWILKKNCGQWLSAQLPTPGGLPADGGMSAFGAAVAVSGTTVAVGDPGAGGVGAVYLYKNCSF